MELGQLETLVPHFFFNVVHISSSLTVIQKDNWVLTDWEACYSSALEDFDGRASGKRAPL